MYITKVTCTKRAKKRRKNAVYIFYFVLYILYYMCVVLQKPVHNLETLLFLFADDDVLCPVKTFVHYKKKLNPKCVFLFQRPSKQPKVDVWYDNMPLGRNQLGIIMSEISKEFALSQVYTNHSLRATTVHVLDAANIAVRHIMSVTGHKSESIL